MGLVFVNIGGKMKYLINGSEVNEIQFRQTFLNYRILQDEKDNIGLTFLRAYLQMTLEKEKMEELTKTVATYEINRVFREMPRYSILGQLFEIIAEPVAAPEEKKEEQQ